MKGKKARTLLLDALCMLAGSAVYAVEVNAFTAPNNIAAGGITGVATMLNYLWGTPIGLVSFLINVPIVLWAVVDIGYKLVAKTVAAIALTSVMIDLFSRFVPAYHGDPILVALFAGLLEGLGLSLIFIRGATTGGSDLVARLLGRRLPHLSMGKLMLAVDGVVVAVSAFVFGSVENAMYACIVIFVSTKLSASWSAPSPIWTPTAATPTSPGRPCSAPCAASRCTSCRTSSGRRTRTPLSLWGRPGKSPARASAPCTPMTSP